MWKRLVGILVGIFLSAAFAQTVNIQLAEVITSPQRTKFLKSLISDFEQANPDIKVTVISLPWGQSFEKFLTMVQSGQIPDVAEVPDKWVGLYGRLHDLVDLTPYLNKSKDSSNFTDLTWTAAKSYKNTPYVVPYGFYIRAMYYNKALFKQAGINSPPATLDEFEKDAQLISKLPGKYAYCLRGGDGGFDSTFYFMSAFMGSDQWFDKDGNSTFDSPGAIKGIQFLVNLYKKGYAPKDSVNWGFNQIVAGLYSNTCAMLDNDPDALSALQSNFANKDDLGVAPLPLGPHDVGFPKVGFSSWGMFTASKHKDADWKLISYLTSPKVSLKWDEFLGGLIPIYKGADKNGIYAQPIHAAWFKELNDSHYKLHLSYPFYLPELGNFLDQLSVSTTQQALLGQKTPEEIAKQWADYLTKAHEKWQANNSK
jgi:multiple sugar transport system substrate-binding protein